MEHATANTANGWAPIAVNVVCAVLRHAASMVYVILTLVCASVTLAVPALTAPSSCVHHLLTAVVMVPASLHPVHSVYANVKTDTAVRIVPRCVVMIASAMAMVTV
jgi:hypothetical protein